MKRILVAGLVGGFIVFAWGAFSHMVLGLGQSGMKQFPAEEPILSSFEANLPEDGLYFFPGFDPNAATSPNQDPAWLEKFRTGPTGLMVYHRRGGEFSFPSLLLVELASNIAAALVAAWLIARWRGGYSARVAAVALFGLFGWLSISVSYWNWYRFPTPYIASEGVDQVVGWLLGGLFIAWMVPKTGLEPARV